MKTETWLLFARILVLLGPFIWDGVLRALVRRAGRARRNW